MVKHFSIAEWTDYVHGLTEAVVADRMRQHLQSGCKQCAGTVNRMEKLGGVIAAEASREVPEYVVHNARSIFRLRQAEKMSLSEVVARLIYDNFGEPLPAGVRTRHRLSRHAIYAAGDICVDLRLEQERGHKVNLVGQVAQRAVPVGVMPHVPISLLAGQQVILQSVSNEYGEFQFEYQPADHVRLRVLAPTGGKAIEVRLNDLAGEGSRLDVLASEEQSRRSSGRN